MRCGPDARQVSYALNGCALGMRHGVLAVAAIPTVLAVDG